MRFNSSNIDTAIRQAQRSLIKQLRANIYYKNFGQAEIIAIREHYIDPSSFTADTHAMRIKLEAFARWCQSVTPEDYSDA